MAQNSSFQSIFWPLLFCIDIKRPDDDCGDLQTPNGKGERLRPIWLDDFAIADSEVIQRVCQIRVQTRLVPESEKLAVALQNEISRAPVFDVFS